VLQNAMNSSPDLYVLGEANLHANVDRPDFASWYNAMHESFGNPPAKGERCPTIEGNGWDVLSLLQESYPRVGEKIAFRARELGYDMAGSLRFLHRWFPRSVYLCTLREPKQVLLSNRNMFGVSDMRPYFRSYLECLAHELDTYLTFDRTYFLVYEPIDERTFDILGRSLEISLCEAYREYDKRIQLARHDGDFGDFARLLTVAEEWYLRLRNIVDPQTLRCPDRVALRRFQREILQTLAALSLPNSQYGTYPLLSVPMRPAQNGSPVQTDRRPSSKTTINLVHESLGS